MRWRSYKCYGRTSSRLLTKYVRLYPVTHIGVWWVLRAGWRALIWRAGKPESQHMLSGRGWVRPTVRWHAEECTPAAGTAARAGKPPPHSAFPVMRVLARDHRWKKTLTNGHQFLLRDKEAFKKGTCEVLPERKWLPPSNQTDRFVIRLRYCAVLNCLFAPQWAPVLALKQRSIS